jgi:hypothetical protein
MLDMDVVWGNLVGIARKTSELCFDEDLPEKLQNLDVELFI